MTPMSHLDPIFVGVDEFWLLGVFSPGLFTCRHWISGRHAFGVHSIVPLALYLSVRDGSGVMFRESRAGEVCATITILLVVTTIYVFVPPFVFLGVMIVGHSGVLVAALIDTSVYLYRLW